MRRRRGACGSQLMDPRHDCPQQPYRKGALVPGGRVVMTGLDSLAAELRWLGWKNEQRGKNITKVPYVAPGRRARANDPTTWRTRRDAEACAMRIVNGLGGGVGIVLGDLGANRYLCGLDLDSCLRDGKLAIWAAAILDTLDTYCEISPSGGGVKAFFYLVSGAVRPFLDRIGVEMHAWGCRRGVPGESSGNHGPAVELYASARFFAV